MTLVPTAQEFLDLTLEALDEGGDRFRPLLDALPVPVYLTDADGLVTYWNEACVDFAGREPELGQDRWCVTWQIHTTDDELLPHDRCPMAVAVREQREVRGEVAIAMRPDGSRKALGTTTGASGASGSETSPASRRTKMRRASSCISCAEL